VNCYLAKDSLPSKTRLIVQVLDQSLIDQHIYKHKEYISSYKDDRSYYYIVFLVPIKWITDITYFRTGRFSLMSNDAKDHIIRYSRLPYKQTKKGQTETDGRLLALDRHPQLRAMWETELSNPRSIVELSDSDELLSIPGDESYLDINRLTPIHIS